MRRRPVRPLVLLLSTLSLAQTGCAATGAAPGPAPIPLPERLDALLTEPPFDRVHWGVLVVDGASGREVFSHNPDLLFIPASNMKIPVTAAALGLLGPEYRWQTTFYSHTLPDRGILEGDLYLPAHGDPTLGQPFHDSSSDALAALADSLVAAGIREVRGRLVVDVSAWDSTTVPESWMIEDLDGRFGATGGAFSIERGELEIRVRGTGAGEPAVVEWSPRGPIPGADGSLQPFVRHDVRTIAAGGEGQIRTSFLPESSHWVVEGTIASGDERTITRSGRAPVRLATGVILRVLSERGIEVSGGVEILWEREEPIETACASGRIPSCAEMIRIAGLASPPLVEVVAAILGPSQNWIAEQLVRTLGSELGREGSWSEGFAVSEVYLDTAVGIGPEEVHWEDGSGMSNHNLISPRALVSILRHARSRPWGSAFRSGMAQGGLQGTTLSSRLESFGGRVFAKTGTLSHVDALSGYVVGATGRELIFSILTNGSNLPASSVRAQADRIVAELAGRSVRE